MEKLKTKTRVDIEAITREYDSNRVTLKALKERNEDIAEQVKASMGDQTELVTASGKWTKYIATRYGWSLDAIKKAFGSRYTSFVKSDDALVRKAMEGDQDPKRSAMLRKSAMVGTTEVIKLA